MVAIGVVGVGGLCRQPDGVPAQPQRNHVREIVRRVRQQRQAVGEGAAESFDDHKSERHEEGECQPGTGPSHHLAEVRVRPGELGFVCHHLSVLDVIQAHTEKLLDVIIAQAVEDLSPFLAAANQPHLPQAPQLMRDRQFAHA